MGTALNDHGVSNEEEGNTSEDEVSPLVAALDNCRTSVSMVETKMRAESDILRQEVFREDFGKWGG